MRRERAGALAAGILLVLAAVACVLVAFVVAGSVGYTLSQLVA